MKKKPVMLGARPHAAGGMAQGHKPRTMSFEAIRHRANAFLGQRGIGFGPSDFDATAQSSSGKRFRQ